MPYCVPSKNACNVHKIIHFSATKKNTADKLSVKKKKCGKYLTDLSEKINHFLTKSCSFNNHHSKIYQNWVPSGQPLKLKTWPLSLDFCYHYIKNWLKRYFSQKRSRNWVVTDDKIINLTKKIWQLFLFHSGKMKNCILRSTKPSDCATYNLSEVQ